MVHWYDRIRPWQFVLLAVGLVGLAAFAEFALGRPPISKSGHIRFWVGAVNSSENSQQLVDWYSFTHLLHGFLLYGALRLAGRGRWPIGLCLVLAVFAEAAWEVVENTDFVIDRYREATISLDYYGDSILNSVFDMFFCALGFVLAAYLPVWLIVATFISIELGLAYAIHDNLTLNVIMLIHPFEAIKHWQMAIS
jgi:hypothetical protein